MSSSSTAAQPPVIIIGAGLAGLTCALALQAKRIPYRLIEADRTPGGRVQTDTVDGFALDRGFQVLQTGYPHAQAVLDFDGLKLGRYLAGARIWNGQRFITVADPLRHPFIALTQSLPDFITDPVATWGDIPKLLALRHRAMAFGATTADWAHHPDLPSHEYLAGQGFSYRVRQQFLNPFYRGVLLDGALRPSARKLLWTFGQFARGHAVIPAGGMGQLTRQLADRIEPGMMRLNTKVRALAHKAVVLDDGDVLPASAIVLATGWKMASSLLGVPSPLASTEGTTCVYFAIPGKPPGAFNNALFLNGSGHGEINHWCFPSYVASGYAPSGQSLACVSLIGQSPLDDEALAARVLAELATYYAQTVVQSWRPLAVYRIADALPAATGLYGGQQQQQGAVQALQRAALERGVLLAGDYLESASIDGAIASGQTAAAAITPRQ